MKKTKTIIVLFLLISLQGCDKLRELATITITTRLETEIPIVVTEFGVNLPGGLNANNAPVQFSVTEVLKIEENFDFQKEFETARKYFEVNIKRKKPSAVIMALKRRGFSSLTMEKLAGHYENWIKERSIKWKAKK